MLPTPTKLRSFLGSFALLLLTISGQSLSAAKEDPLKIGGEVFELKPFVVYEADVDIIDGHTGEKYEGTNDVVLDFADTFNLLLLGFHKKLLVYEINHLNFRLEDGKAFVSELTELAESFGITHFKVNHDNWLRREIAIVQRLSQDPFFKIEALVAWDLDRLNRNLPSMPTSKFATDIRYNETKEIWERRVTTEWRVSHRTISKNGKKYGQPINVLKEQGLNLDTQEGFHILDRGLSAQVVPNAFKDVKLTYPIIVSSNEPKEEQVKRLQQIYIKNLTHIYDPFSWMARRENRFRGGFGNELLRHFKGRRYKISDREWFDPVLCNLLNDMITIKRHGTKEIYSLEAYQKFEHSRNILGEDLDLLNWLTGEKRQGAGKSRNPKFSIKFDNPGGARFIVLDAYMRYTDKFVNTLRDKLTSLKKTANGREIIEQSIEEVSGIPMEKYIKMAIQAQSEMVMKYRIE
ncbi:MAG: hypothetical protein O3C43_14155 [Verrucomicrobia bacterium]|nr:hypothetical protein [Verrucomicrobiota bacterium]MDA1067635.1 hypothetical protein [Verrucomicrobiota bacterium]